MRKEKKSALEKISKIFAPKTETFSRILSPVKNNFTFIFCRSFDLFHKQKI